MGNEMSELLITNILIDGWGEYQGHYRGSFFEPPQSLPFPDRDPERAKGRKRQREAFEIAKSVCQKRDLWKQNEVDAIAFMVRQVLDQIDAQRLSTTPSTTDRSDDNAQAGF